MCLYWLGDTIKISAVVVLLGVVIHQESNFKSEMENISQIVHTENNLVVFDCYKGILIAHAFVNSQFHYLPMIQMVAGKTVTSNVEKNKLQNYTNCFSTLKMLSKFARNTCFLITEILKATRKLNPIFMWDYFSLNYCVYSFKKIYSVPLISLIQAVWYKSFIFPWKYNMKQTLKICEDRRIIGRVQRKAKYIRKNKLHLCYLSVILLCYFSLLYLRFSVLYQVKYCQKNIYIYFSFLISIFILLFSFLLKIYVPVTVNYYR